MFDVLKDTHNSPPPWFNVVPSLQKLCQAGVAVNGATKIGENTTIILSCHL